MGTDKDIDLILRSTFCYDFLADAIQGLSYQTRAIYDVPFSALRNTTFSHVYGASAASAMLAFSYAYGPSTASRLHAFSCVSGPFTASANTRVFSCFVHREKTLIVA